MGWVGRRLPRYEDPVLLQGRGRFVADLAGGARAMRFVRSPVARGRILSIKAPPGAQVITAADLHAVKPLCPRLLRPDFVPIAQPILAGERVVEGKLRGSWPKLATKPDVRLQGGERIGVCHRNAKAGDQEALLD